ncbi:serine/threonine-protein kinase/endoribonuclease IRE1-like [Bidens hawaiensis]|uniref:serine/threonine-protein kinase/endoribonuclease IRE1-like n=1 Tax=Bidens hawaiensis TaxID=980011 RepID=UPI004049AFA7
MESFNGYEETVIWSPSQVFLDKEIGRGSNGTIVYQGTYPRGHRVAVKRLSEDQYNAKRQGYDTLKSGGDDSVHIVRLYEFQKHENFIYAMVSLCEYDLHHLVKSKWLYAELSEENGYPKPYLLELMRNVVDGLQNLHRNGIIYGDLNPSHVFIHKTQIAKLSMVGSCRCLAEDETSLRSDDTIIRGEASWGSC